MPELTDTNEAERRRWNDPAWTAQWLHRQALTANVIAYLLGALAPADGERILEVGCGTGRTAVSIAAAVPGGSVVGADISRLLVGLARQRAEEQNLANAEFVVADMQRDRVPGGPFDAVVSQFGVMFFDEPVRAFANLRGQVTPGGRLVFICWREQELNPWQPSVSLAPFLPPAPEPAPGKSRTGPFTLADFAATKAMLEAAGWTGVAAHDHDLTVTVPRDALFEDGSLAYYGVPEADRDQALQAVTAQLAPLKRPDGRYDAPSPSG